jgi:hypothetical protein
MKRWLLLPLVLLLSLPLPAQPPPAPNPNVRFGGSDRAATTGAFASDLDAESRELDRQLQSTDAHRELLQRLSADLIAGRRTLPEAATLLADFSRRSKPEWLRWAGKRYPGRSEQASVAASLVYYTLFRLQEGNPADEDTARRLAADYRAGYGMPFTLPADKGAPIPPGWPREERDGLRQ